MMSKKRETLASRLLDILTKATRSLSRKELAYRTLSIKSCDSYLAEKTYLREVGHVLQVMRKRDLIATDTWKCWYPRGQATKGSAG